MKRPFAVNILYQNGPERRPFGCSYIRLLLSLGHNTNQDATQLSMAPNCVRADVLLFERMWRSLLGEVEAFIDRAPRPEVTLKG